MRSSGIQIGGTIFYKSTQILAFADDIVIISRNQKTLCEQFIELEKAAQDMGMEINVQKTKYMFTGQENTRTIETLSIQEHEFERVTQFKYLGSIITTENGMVPEIKARLLAANRGYFGMSRLFRSKILKRSTKIKMYKTLIKPILLYGAETWTMTKAEENSLRSFERKILRRIYGPINERGFW